MSGEDVDLNQRLRAAGIETIINQTAPIYHLSHRYEQSWKSDESDKATKTLYLSNKAKGFPAIPITADWGRFGGCR
jgi:GT2 family glycosyltransferase